MKKFACIAFTTVFSTAAFAQDPSFNGLFSTLKCDAKSITQCDGEFCRQLLGPISYGEAGSVIIDFKNKTYMTTADGIRQPYELVDVSKAEINKPLWSKIRIKISDTDVNMTIVSSPKQGGGYSNSAAAIMPPRTDGISTIFAMSCGG